MQTLWHPSCHSDCEIQDMTCQDEPLQHIVAMQLSLGYTSLQRKAFKVFPWWDECRCTAPRTLKCYFFSNRMVYIKYADEGKWLQDLFSSLIVVYFPETTVSLSILRKRTFESGTNLGQAVAICFSQWRKQYYKPSKRFWWIICKKKGFQNLNLKELFYASTLTLNFIEYYSILALTQIS